MAVDLKQYNEELEKMLLRLEKLRVWDDEEVSRITAPLCRLLRIAVIHVDFYANPGAEHVEPVSPYGIDPASYANQLYQLVNQQRKLYGVPQLVWNPALNNAVSVRAVEVSQYFSHIRPNGLSFYTTMSGVTYWNCGEIISSSPYSPVQVMDAWMNDPGDKYNILKSQYTGMAVGYYYNPMTPDKYYWVIIFTV